jgi:hypothetical protein
MYRLDSGRLNPTVGSKQKYNLGSKVGSYGEDIPTGAGKSSNGLAWVPLGRSHAAVNFTVQ